MNRFNGCPQRINGTDAHNLKYAPPGYVAELSNRAGRRARVRLDAMNAKRRVSTGEALDAAP